MNTDSIKVLIVDDHNMVVEGLLLMLGNLSDIHVTGTASNGQECIQFLENECADVILLDINMPVLNGIETCKIIQDRYPKIRIIVLSMLSEVEMVRRMIDLGASGYLLKNAGKEELIDAIRTVMKGKNAFDEQILKLLLQPHKKEEPTDDLAIPSLTRRQKEILQLITEEYTTSEIAEKLNLGFGTVETHRRNMISKLGVRNTAGLVRAVYEHELLKN